MARRFVTYNTEDQKAGSVPVNEKGVLMPHGGGSDLPVSRIVFTDDGTNYTCNVPYEEFETAVMSGLPMVYVDKVKRFVMTDIYVTESDGTWNIMAGVSDSSVKTMVYTSSGLTAGGPPPS